jgi:hypothetical protein
VAARVAQRLIREIRCSSAPHIRVVRMVETVPAKIYGRESASGGVGIADLTNKGGSHLVLLAPSGGSTSPALIDLAVDEF